MADDSSVRAHAASLGDATRCHAPTFAAAPRQKTSQHALCLRSASALDDSRGLGLLVAHLGRRAGRHLYLEPDNCAAREVIHDVSIPHADRRRRGVRAALFESLVDDEGPAALHDVAVHFEEVRSVGEPHPLVVASNTTSEPRGRARLKDDFIDAHLRDLKTKRVLGSQRVEHRCVGVERESDRDERTRLLAAAFAAELSVRANRCVRRYAEIVSCVDRTRLRVSPDGQTRRDRSRFARRSRRRSCVRARSRGVLLPRLLSHVAEAAAGDQRERNDSTSQRARQCNGHRGNVGPVFYRSECHDNVVDVDSRAGRRSVRAIAVGIHADCQDGVADRGRTSEGARSEP